MSSRRQLFEMLNRAKAENEAQQSSSSSDVGSVEAQQPDTNSDVGSNVSSNPVISFNASL